MDLVMDFREDARQAFVNALIREGYKIAPDISFDRASITLFNVLSRLIRPAPRVARWSSELKGKELDPGIASVVEAIVTKSADGENLRPFLSKLILKPNFTDHMLFEWKVHHFHLGSFVPSTKGFVARSDELLFVLVGHADIYLLDQGTHESFDDSRFIQIVHDNWPCLIDRYRMCGVSPSRSDELFTQEERKNLRRKGGNLGTQMTDGTVYAPIGGGIVCAGSSLSIRIEADRFDYQLAGLEEGVQPHLDAIVATVRRAHGAAHPVRVHIEFDDEWRAWVYDETRTVRLRTDIALPRFN